MGETPQGIDFGLDDPEVYEMYRRAISIIGGPIADGASKAFAIEECDPTSELMRLHDGAAPGILDVISALTAALSGSHGALAHIAYVCSNGVPTYRSALQSLLRTALVGTARTLYVILPADPATRMKHARRVLAQDCDSGVRGIKTFVKFDALEAFKAPRQVLEDLQDQRQNLQPEGGSSRDGEVIDGMVQALIDALRAAGMGDDELGEALLTEHARWMWNTYSGLAHAYYWPRVLPGVTDDRHLPGDFVYDLYQITVVHHVALLAFLDRSSPGSAGTRTDVPLSG